MNWYNDPADYQTTTNYPKLGRWGNGTNQGTGTFQIVDLGTVYSLHGVGYNIDWDGAFKNPLTFRVEVSTDNKTWQLASEIVHPYSPHTSFNKIDFPDVGKGRKCRDGSPYLVGPHF